MPTYADDSERRLGAALAADIEAVLRVFPSGRELMSHLKGRDGLPAVLVLKLSQRPGDPGYGQAGAVASPDGSYLALNFWAVRGAALGRVPPAERSALGKRLSTPAALQDWLLRNPDQRRSFVRQLDSTLFHELTHCWQARRGRFEVEMLRGNAPSVNPLEKEHEAFRSQARYFHDTLLFDPGAAVASPEFQSYQSLLADYGQYKDGITRLYMANFPGSSDFPTAAALQRERRGISQVLGRSNWSEWARQALRRAGFSRGDAALRSDEEDYRARERDFVDRELPRMRREGAAALIAHFEKAGRPGQALAAARQRGAQTTPGQRVALFERALAGLRRPGGDPDQRASDVGVLARYLVERETDGPPDFSELQLGIYRNAARHYLARAAKADGAERAHLLEWAESYATGASDEGLLAQVARMRGRPK